MKVLLVQAHPGFRHVRLQAEDASAARLYESLGFHTLEKQQHATHTMPFAE